MRALPAGSVVRIVNDQAIVIAHTADGANWVGRDLSKLDSITRHIAAKEAKEVTRWSDGVERITGSSTAHDGALACFGRAADRHRLCARSLHGSPGVGCSPAVR